jgi:hypothetical protein
MSLCRACRRNAQITGCMCGVQSQGRRLVSSIGDGKNTLELQRCTALCLRQSVLYSFCTTMLHHLLHPRSTWICHVWAHPSAPHVHISWTFWVKNSRCPSHGSCFWTSIDIHKRGTSCAATCDTLIVLRKVVRFLEPEYKALYVSMTPTVHLCLHSLKVGENVLTCSLTMSKTKITTTLGYASSRMLRWRKVLFASMWKAFKIVFACWKHRQV